MATDVIGIEVLLNSSDFDKGAKSVIEGINRIINQLTVLNAMTFASGKNIGAMANNMQENSKKIVDSINKIGSSFGGIGGGDGGGFSKAGEDASDDFIKGFANINWSRVIRDFQGFGSVLGGALGGPLGMALGSTLGGAIDKVLSTIKNKFEETFRTIAELGKKAFDILIGKASYFQDEMIYLDTLLARIAVDEGSFGSVGEALDSLGDSSDKLLDRIQKLALETPYAIDEVMRMFRSLTGRGVGIDQTIRTIKALSDAGAGLSLPNYELTRLTQNLVQVATTGKLYERDIYEFGRAGIDATQMISQYLNMSLEEAKQALKDGTISAELFLDVFNQFSADKFEGAAERMTRTVTGMQQKLQDLLNFLGKDLFGPLLDKISEPFSKIIDAMVNISRTPIFESIGNSIANMFTSMDIITGESVASIQYKIMQFIRWLINASGTLASYGYKMMLQWGIGLVKGAIQAITAVVRIISRMFSFFLAPGSPPRAVPEIYNWGVAALTEFMKGMTNADFSILNAIQDPLEKVLSQLEFEPNQITDLLQQFTVGFTKALEKFKLTGIIDEGFLNQIRSMGYEYGDALANLAELQFELSGAQTALKVAEDLLELEKERLEAAKEYYEESDIGVRKLVQEYNDLLRAGASKDILLAKKAEIDAAMENREIAKENIKQQEEAVEEAENQVDIAQEQLEAIQEQVDAQEELLNQLLKLTEYEKEALKLSEGLGESLGDIEMPEFDFPAIDIGDTGMDDLDRDMRVKMKLLERNILIDLAQMRGNWNTFVDEMKSKWNEVDWDTEVKPLLESLQDLSDGFTGVLDVLTSPGGLNEALDNLFTNLTGLEGIFSKEGFTEDLGKIFDFAKGGGVPGLVFGWLGDILEDSGFSAEIDLDKIIKFVTGGGVPGVVGGWITGLFGGLDFGTIFGDLDFSALWTGLQEVGTNIGTSVSGWWESIKGFFTDIDTAANEGWNTFIQWTITSLASIGESMYTWIAEKKESWNTFWDELNTKVNEIWTEMSTWISEKITEIGTAIQTFIDEKKTAWDTFWTDVHTKATEVMEEIRAWIDEKILAIKGYIDNFTGLLGGLATGFDTAKEAARLFIEKLGELIRTLAEAVIPDWLWAFIAQSPAPLAVGLKQITGELGGLVHELPKLTGGLSTNLMPRNDRITPSTVSTNSTANTFNFGGNNINNGMDAALFEAMVRRSVERIMT